MIKTIVVVALLLILFGIVGRMDYEAAVARHADRSIRMASPAAYDADSGVRRRKTLKGSLTKYPDRRSSFKREI